MNSPAKPTSTTAIISLVSGILGWTLLPFLGSVVAIVCGHMARAEIKRSNGMIDGDGMAIAGLILGWLSVALAVLSVIGIILFFGGLAAFLAILGANAH
jgi:Domain of unknown function (DUF4190)